MSGRGVVYAVCSFDKGFHKLVEKLKEAYPDAELVAVLTAEQRLTPSEEKYVDRVLRSSAGTLSAFGGLGGLVSLARAIRATEPLEVAVQFESVKLRLFGIACRPKKLGAWLGNGNRLELSLRVTETLADLYVHRARGYAAVARAAWHAFVLSAVNEPPERPARRKP